MDENYTLESLHLVTMQNEDRFKHDILPVKRLSRRWKTGEINPSVFIKRNKIKEYETFRISLFVRSGIWFSIHGVTKFSGGSNTITEKWVIWNPHSLISLRTTSCSRGVPRYNFWHEFPMFSYLKRSKCSETIFSLTRKNGLLILKIKNLKMEKRDRVPSIPRQTCNRQRGWL